MGLVVVTPPSCLPLHVTEARLHIKQDETYDDLRIIGTIATGAEMAENECQATFVACRYKFTLDCLPTGFIELEYGPVLSVISIKYIGFDGNQVTWPTTEWVADLTRNPARISPRFGRVWMIPLPQIATIEIIYDSGYAAPITATGNSINVLGIWRTQVVGDVIRLSNSGGALPAPLQASTDYFIATVGGSSYTLSATSGGAAITLTDTGSGQSFIGQIPAGVRQWMLLRLGSMDENRSSDQMMRGTLLNLPYIDALLDPSRAVSY